VLAHETNAQSSKTALLASFNAMMAPAPFLNSLAQLHLAQFTSAISAQTVSVFLTRNSALMPSTAAHMMLQSNVPMVRARLQMPNAAQLQLALMVQCSA